MARAATAPELAYYNSPGKWSKLYAAILTPPIVYRARINQTFSTYDQVLSIIFDGGSGTLANVLPDMEVWIGTAVDTYDKGICRLRDKDATHFYLSETSEIAFADNDYVTIVAAFGVWARPVRILSNLTVYMDEVTYTNQHTSWDPQPNMGSHRILELTGASVSTSFNASTSFCIGSSISSYSWSCSTASGVTGQTTATPTFTFNTVGWHIVYLTLTAANGKTFFGVRYVYVWNEANPPAQAEITDPGKCIVETGGWSIGLTLRHDVTLEDVHNRAMVILFSKDYYDGEEVAIGPVTGSENINFVGWIAGEVNTLSVEDPTVNFVAQGAAFWMTKIPSWPDGVELTNGTADAWTNVNSLTVDKGTYHFLRWRSTITRVADVTLSGDTKLTQEVSSSAQNLWLQLQEMTWNQIYVRPGVNALGQLSLDVHPCLIPTASRTYPTVLNVTEGLREGLLEIERTVIDEVGIVDMSGVIVESAGQGVAKFALAPGHSLPHYGIWDIQPNLLLSSQAQVITLAGLYRSWRNSPFKNLPVTFLAPVRLLDCFPNQKCTITIDAADNPRGISYSGGIVPTEVSMTYDPLTGQLKTSAVFEAQTSESQAIQGDTPGSGDTDGPAVPSFPDIPDFPPIFPGVDPPTDEGPTVVVIHTTDFGLMYTTTFDETNPTWLSFNAGLTAGQANSVNRFVHCPSGVCYCGYMGGSSSNSSGGWFIARAPSLGGTWTVLHSSADLSSGSNQWGVLGLGINPLLPESVGAVIEDGTVGSPVRFYLYTNGVETIGASVESIGSLWGQYVSYGLGKWMCTTYNKVRLLPPDGSSVTIPGTTQTGQDRPHIRASTTGKTFHAADSPNHFYIGTDNFASRADAGVTVFVDDSFNGPAYIACDPTGQFLMSGNKIRSSDGGFTWVSIPNLPAGTWWYDYAGPGENNLPRFVASGGTSVRYSPDYGETWINKEGNLIPMVPDINMTKVITY